MTNLLNDISVLTNVSESTLKKFTPIINNCIGHAVHETECAKEDITKIDLSIGQLIIKISYDGIHYRFVPSKELENILVKTVTTGSSPILDKLETNLQQKIDRTYKELL